MKSEAWNDGVRHLLCLFSSFCHLSSPSHVTLSNQITSECVTRRCISDVKYFTKSCIADTCSTWTHSNHNISPASSSSFYRRLPGWFCQFLLSPLPLLVPDKNFWKYEPKTLNVTKPTVAKRQEENHIHHSTRKSEHNDENHIHHSTHWHHKQHV